MSKRNRIGIIPDEYLDQIEENALILVGEAALKKPKKGIISFDSDANRIVINNLHDLINLGKKYDPDYDYNCPLNLEQLNKMIEPLEELNGMIGLTEFKNNIIDQIIFNLTTDMTDKEHGLLHMALYGEPGVGKTSIGEIMGRLYASMGLLKKGHVVMAKRTDLIGEYLGQTAHRTQKVLESALDGIIFIDEVYSLGHSDSIRTGSEYSKECVDTINQFLTEHANDIICIIAGYRDEVEKVFFAQNRGLARRFPYQYVIANYTPAELFEMFKLFIKQEGNWSFTQDALNYIEEMLKTPDGKLAFANQGGDLKVFFKQCRITHTRRAFILNKEEHWHKVTLDDVRAAFKTYLSKRIIKNNSAAAIESEIPHGLYI